MIRFFKAKQEIVKMLERNYLIYFIPFFYCFEKLNVLKLSSEHCIEMERENLLPFQGSPSFLSNNYLLNLAEVNKKFQVWASFFRKKMFCFRK